MVKTLCEVYSRVVGYIRPVANWNDSKQAEFHDRKHFIFVGESRSGMSSNNLNIVNKIKEVPKKDVVEGVRDSQTHL